MRSRIWCKRDGTGRKLFSLERSAGTWKIECFCTEIKRSYSTRNSCQPKMAESGNGHSTVVFRACPAWNSRRTVSPVRFDSGILVSVPSKSVFIFFMLIAASGALPVRLQSAQASAGATTGQNAPQLPPQPPQQASQPPAQQAIPPRNTLAVVVLDPAHGGADQGARGSSGIAESDVVLSFARLVRISLEAQGLRVI